ncbi:MAG: hypothetical protein Q7K57_39780 [Burkholderiaceae bacterium]|nr:hypothetical protein [Burkholderiaceae bacterium]
MSPFHTASLRNCCHLFVLALSLFSPATHAQSHIVSEKPWIELKGALEIIRKLSADDAIPFSQESLESATGTKLYAPDTNYPPEVLEQLKRIGHPPPEKPRYLEGSLLISQDMSLYIQFPWPSINLEFRPFGYVMPKVITDKVLKELPRKSEEYSVKAFKNNCLRKYAVFDVLDNNGWTFSKSEFSEERESTTGNFEFVNLSRSAMAQVTVERNCFEQLRIYFPK